ncbi:serine hydrolase domain-containing protein [Gemmatimonas sp.]|jgi:CubicO group peptidase (beta-lactamase class C family)|uniref:serine hydrolase domain-containing protein n=1 Tax=Gemmatimonas sp. TaxID=1962908 RepID=UPI0037C0F36F
MTSRRQSLIGTAFLFTLLAVTPNAQAQGVAPTPGTLAANPDILAAERLFSAWMEGQLAYRGLPGVAVGVVYDQQLVWSQGFGFADVKNRVPMTPQVKFRIASHSKMFAAIAIMQLREEGKIRLDDPVEKYLPWFKAKPAGDDDGVITIEQLLSHTSGLQREAGDHWTSYNFPSEDELKRLYSDRQAAFAPNVRWKYSNLAFAVAGLVVEQITGQKWAAYVQQQMFTPLGMSATSVDQNVSGLTVPYMRRMPDGSRDVLPFVDARGMAAATGMTSNVDDLAKFVSAQFRRGPRGGAQILSAGSWREMHRVRAVDETWQSGSGLGFDFNRIENRTWVGHGGGYPGNTTQTLFQVNDKVGVIVLTNTNDANPSQIAEQLIATVGAAVLKAAPARAQTVTWDPTWARFAGWYRSAMGDSRVVLLNEKLVMMSPTSTTVGTPSTLEPLGGGRFRLMAPGGGGAIGEVVRFVEENGAVTRMYVGDGYQTRLR